MESRAAEEESMLEHRSPRSEQESDFADSLALFAEAPEAMILLDLESDLLLELNRKAEELLGPREIFLGRPSRALCAYPGEHGFRLGSLPRRESIEFDLRRSEGSTFPALISLATLRLEGRELLLAVFRDDSRRRRIEGELKASEGRYRDLFENANDAIFLVDSRLRYVDVNRKAIEIFGYSREEFLSMSILDVIPPEQVALSRQEFEKLHRDGAYEKFEGRMRRKDGTWVDIEVNSSAIFENGKFAGSRDIVRDISHRKKAEEELNRLNRLLEEQATHDQLTGLPNRRLLMDRLEQALIRAGRSGLKVGVVFFDLDHFKAVNDRFGHSVGDELLSWVATRLANKVRRSDMVARLGGDEFVAVLENLRFREDAETAARNLMTSFNYPFSVQGEVLNLYPSAGISLYPDDGQTPEDLIAGADAAMYEVKRRRSRRDAAVPATGR